MAGQISRVRKRPATGRAYTEPSRVRDYRGCLAARNGSSMRQFPVPMRLIFFLGVAAAICWYFITTKPPMPPSAVMTAAPVNPVVQSTPPPPIAPPVAPAPITNVMPAPKSVETPNPSEAPQIVLENVLGPNNHYHDDLVGLSVTFPEEWKVRTARRWGTNNHENTVYATARRERRPARPSMYYKQYVDTPPDPSTAEAYLRRQAQQKEDSRIAAGLTDYKNVPDSFAYIDINGSPALSYFATFTRGDQVMTENFIRVLGPKGYVMFFTSGKLEDVQAILPHLKQMAASLKGP
jgi:hypothetical protein